MVCRKSFENRETRFGGRRPVTISQPNQNLVTPQRKLNFVGEEFAGIKSNAVHGRTSVSRLLNLFEKFGSRYRKLAGHISPSCKSFRLFRDRRMAVAILSFDYLRQAALSFRHVNFENVPETRNEIFTTPTS
jgi:hypothetical protein